MQVPVAETTRHDVIIIGGGPAGLQAALILGRCRRRVVVFDDGRPRNDASTELHGFLTRDGIDPHELRRLAREQLKQYDTVELRDMTVIDAAPIDRGFVVITEDGRQWPADKLVLASGVEDEKPDLDGFRQFYGRGVHHCPYCDGWEVRDTPLAVLSSGQQGVGLAEEVSVWSRDVTLCTNGIPLSEHQRERVERRGIKVRDQLVRRLVGDERLRSIEFEDGSGLQVSAMFFGLAHRQRSRLPEKLGCELTDEGVVPCGEAGETSVAGLYIAGDASRRLPVHFVIAAAAEGAEAAAKINQELLKRDLGLEAPTP